MAWESTDGEYTGYLDASPDGPPAMLEEMPATTDLVAALAWAAKRSERVVVRPEFDDGTSYWAGHADPPANAAHFPRLNREGRVC